MTAFQTLLDPAFVRELEVLRRRLEIRARSGGAGEHAARRRGGSAEFQEHRAYEPGDDLRRVDWLAFARTGTPVVKLFRSEEDVVVRLLVDASASLDWGDPRKVASAELTQPMQASGTKVASAELTQPMQASGTKFDVARRLAAALGYVALAGGQRAQLFVAREKSGAGRSASLERVGSPRRGRTGLVALLRELSAATPSAGADLGRAIEAVVQRSARPGWLVVLSDFLDAGPFIDALARARSAGHDVALVHVVARAEMEPSFEGDFTLVDAETGNVVDVTMDPSALDAYVLRFAGLVEELRAFARKHGASYVRALTDEPLEGVVRRLIAREVD